MRTKVGVSITLDLDTVVALRDLAVQRDVTLAKVINDLLVEKLKEMKRVQ